MDLTSKMKTVETSDSGLIPGTILKRCDNAQNGVSVRNMPEWKDGFDWYVFRASYGREDKAYKLLEGLDADIYIPRHTVYVRTKGGVKSIVKKLMPNFVFAYLSEYDARLFTKGPAAFDETFKQRAQGEKRDIFELNTLVSFYYNHFVKDENGMNPPLVVPYNQMKDFFIATRLEKDVIPVVPGTFKAGEQVEVIEGEFKGLTGRVIREERSKKKLLVQLTNNGTMLPPSSRTGEDKCRLFFQLPCIGSFGSAYIPTAYFRKVE